MLDFLCTDHETRLVAVFLDSGFAEKTNLDGECVQCTERCSDSCPSRNKKMLRRSRAIKRSHLRKDT